MQPDNETLQYMNAIQPKTDVLGSWLSKTRSAIEERFGVTDGVSCIIFNANPCTLGHRYIMEIASKRSRGVVVFVIEGKTDSGSLGNHENSNIEIPFKDRLEQTQMCAHGIPNVLVLPGGPYTIGRDDFPSQWSTVERSRAHSYAILNSKLLCQVILPGLGITNMFAGDEPRDEMSEMHLNALRQQCRDRGIGLKVAERKRLGDRYISSAMVRGAAANGDWDTVSATVQPFVYEYLSGSYRGGLRS